ncbi:hypothetical protein [Gilvibacter sp.]|uniref:hypothetical protein n=1 Tax=Gilvibacter sp. TaxID=2729997 RepID=UPI0025BC5B5A|nr:hypothetical protein [Gilvibacter sp.]NQX78644.1 hypothetical protein [Gilvibacter sp.]
MTTATAATSAAKPKTTKLSTTTSGISPEITAQLSSDINCMLGYASRNAIPIDTQLLGLIENSSVEDLINAHNVLVKNISPATPKSIRYTRALYKDEQQKSIFRRLPLVRNLMLLALVFLACFIVTALSPEVNNDSLDKGVLDNEGRSLLLNLVFLASISGLGVAFYLLKTVSSAVKNGTLITEDSIYYMALIVLGVIAGLLVSEIIVVPAGGTADSVSLFDKSVLALLGGFSSDAIFTVLQSIITRLKGLLAAPAN